MPADAGTVAEASAPAKAKPRTNGTRATRSNAKPTANREAKPAAKGAAPAKPMAAGATARRTAPRMRQPAQPAGVPRTPREVPPEDPSSRHLLGTAAQAAAELAEIGLSASARALRRVVDRLPRP